MPLNNFNIVEFEDGIQIVPKLWITKNKKECYLPQFEPVRYNRAVRTCMKVDKRTWPKYPIIRIMGSADTYQRGMKKLFRAEERSDIDHSTDHVNESTPKRRRTAIFVSDEASDDSLPTFPEPTISTPTNCELAEGRSQEIPRAGHVSQRPIVPISTPEQPEDILSSSLTSKPSLASIMTEIVKLQYQVTQLSDKLSSSLEKANDVPIAPTHTTCIPTFPLSSEEQLFEMDEKLNSDEHFKNALITQLRKLGGKSISQLVQNQMKFILSPQLGNKFSYYGTKEKKAFCSLKLCSLIGDVVRLYQKATNDDMKEPMQTYFRHTKDKINKEL